MIWPVPKYRKKPIEIEAICWPRDFGYGHVVDWIVDNGGKAEYHLHLMDGDLVAHPDPYILIETLEGNMVASKGDYIIKGIQGEFYPCKPDIFEASYEKVEGT